jgi:hypothetical protein
MSTLILTFAHIVVALLVFMLGYMTLTLIKYIVKLLKLLHLKDRDIRLLYTVIFKCLHCYGISLCLEGGHPASSMVNLIKLDCRLNKIQAFSFEPLRSTISCVHFYVISYVN